MDTSPDHGHIPVLLERCVELLRPALTRRNPDGSGAVLVDASHANHAEQTCQLVAHALGDERLLRLVNTHLHSDHCGGNAALKAAFGMPISVAPTWSSSTRVPTESLPASMFASSRSRQAISMS